MQTRAPDAASDRALQRDEINDDLNLPRALAVAWEVLRGDLPPAVKRATLAQFDDVLGLGLAEWTPKARRRSRRDVARWPTRG